MPLYTQRAMNYFWLIDPGLQTLETYVLQDSNWSLKVTFADDDSVSIAPFAEHSF